jgi:hypothetical protein
MDSRHLLERRCLVHATSLPISCSDVYFENRISIFCTWSRIVEVVVTASRRGGWPPRSRCQTMPSRYCTPSGRSHTGKKIHFANQNSTPQITMQDWADLVDWDEVNRRSPASSPASASNPISLPSDVRFNKSKGTFTVHH